MAGYVEMGLPELPSPRIDACQDKIALSPWSLVLFLFSIERLRNPRPSSLGSLGLGWGSG